MLTQKVSESQIAITVVPKRVRWPKPSTATVCAKAHDSVDALHRLIRQTDFACSKAEEDSELNASGIGRRRAEVCDRTVTQLANFGLFEIAEHALNESISTLERLSYRDPEQVRTLEKLKEALTDLREGIPASQRMVRERCKVR
jgi:hypothetical protein